MYIGIDFGTSGIKAILMTQEQTLLADFSVELQPLRVIDGWSEQDSADLNVTFESELDDLAGQMDLSAVKSIGLSGQMHGATVLDAADKGLRLYILWNDTRANAKAAQLYGNIVFPRLTGPKLLWIKHDKPNLFDRTFRAFSSKDYLRLRLTDEPVSEMSDAAGTSWLDTGQRDCSDKLFAATGLDRSYMPHLVEGCEQSGAVPPSFMERKIG
jgi:xylulokinase